MQERSLVEIREDYLKAGGGIEKRVLPTTKMIRQVVKEKGGVNLTVAL